MEVNEAGEIIITLMHEDSKVLITPDHSLYARLKAIIDSGARPNEPCQPRGEVTGHQLKFNS